MGKAIVVGGGIAGLATAVALERRGWDIEVFERAPAFGEVGAGLSLWPNALAALDALGVGDQVRASARAHGQAGIRTRDGRWLARTDDTAIRSRFGDAFMIHRADLLESLRSALPDDALSPGVTAHSVTSDGVVEHSGGTSTADLVVGADGARSAVRSSLWRQASLSYVGYGAWRFVTSPLPDITESGESWGYGERFGYSPLKDGRVYCFAVANLAEGALADDLSSLRKRFGQWHDPIPRLLAATSAGGLLHHGLYELSDLPSFVDGKVALVGDAAHAMTPNLGQGACQALEDAVELAVATDQAGGLQTYDSRRRPRTQMVVRASRRIGALAQMESSWAARLRNTLVAHFPTSLSNRNLLKVLDWELPY